MSAVREFGLYYPYIHVQNDVWLKAAALYWPSLGRMVPHGYVLQDSPTAQRLRDELDFFVDVDPRRYAKRVANEFAVFVDMNADRLRARYRVPPDAIVHDISPEQDPRLVWIHAYSKMDYGLAFDLADAGLAVVHREDRRLGLIRLHIGMHPQLGYVYLAALADRVAQANHMPAVTDQYDVHGTLNGWTVDTLAEVLLDGDFAEEVPRNAAENIDEIRRLYLATAIATVVPKGLEHVPAERIVRARRTLADEFDAFRAHLDSLNEQFTELAGIESPEVLHAELRLLVDRDIRRPTANLERGLRQLGMEPARAVLGMKSLELPATVAAAAAGAGVPVVVGQAGLVAAQLVTSSLRARNDAHQQRRGVAGYLLGLREELDPRGVVDRLRRTLRGISVANKRRRGLPGPHR